MMTLDPDDQFFQEDDSHSRDDDLKNTKDNQLYKDTMALLKRKMCTAQDLLEQFNHKVKEYNDLNLELHELKIDKEKLFNKYNAASEKLTRLELSNRDCEKSRDEYKCTYDKQKLELDEKKKHIEQLEFRIKEMEKDSVHRKDEIKKLQQENKISKSVAKKATKDKGNQTNLNTDFNKVSPRKPQTKDKSVITDNDTMPCPVFCSKCENQVEFPPVRQILKIMSTPPPPSVTNQFSPPCSPRSIPSSLHPSESVASNTLEQYYHGNPYSNSLDRKMIEKSRNAHEEPDRPSFMLIDQLTRKINNLERLIKKKKWKQKEDDGCHKKCCPSKNIKFVVQLPHDEKYLEYGKLSRSKQKNVKRLNKKQIKSKKNKKLRVREWQVDSEIEIENEKLTLQHNTDQSENKYTNLIDNNEPELFDTPAVVVPNLTPNIRTSEDSCASETVQTPHVESLSKFDANADEVTTVNLTNKDMVCDDENENECNMQSSVSNPVLVHTSCHENIVEEANQRLDCINGKVFQTTDSERNLCLDLIKETNSNEAFDFSSEHFNDTNLGTLESDKSENVDTKNEDIVCTNNEKEEINDEAVVLKMKSILEDQENGDETKNTSSNTRKFSISSTSSSEYDELFSTPHVHTLPDKDLHLDIPKDESQPNSIQEIEKAEKTNILRSNDQINSSAIDKIQEIEQAEKTNILRSNDQIDSSAINKIQEIEKAEKTNILRSNDQIDSSAINKIQEIEKAEKTNILRSNDQINSSAIDKIEAIDSPIRDNDITENSMEKQINDEGEIGEVKEENEQSSDDSLNLKCRISKIKKRGKCSNIIESDDSSEETPRVAVKSKYRKSLLGSKKRIISKINKLRKISNYPTTSKQTPPTDTDIRNNIKDITDSYIPSKKQRIAHIPKNNIEVKDVLAGEQSLQTVEDICKVQNSEFENVLSQPKLVNKRVKTTTEGSTRKTKKLKLTKKAQSQENDVQQPAVLDTVKLEQISTVDEPLELTDKDKDHQTDVEITIKENGGNENTHEEKVKDETTDEASESDSLASQTIMDKTECTENFANVETSNIRKEENKPHEESLDDSKKDPYAMSEDEETVPAKSLRGRLVAPKTPNRRISRRLQEHSPSAAKPDVATNKCDADMVPAPASNKQTQKKIRTKTKKTQSKLPFESSNSSLGDTPLVSYFNDFLLGVNQERREENFEYLKKYEKRIREQLSILIDTEPLTTEVLLQVTENLLQITSLEVVALVLIECSSTEYLDDVKCNTTYTPPAPPMTKFEQKLVTLIMTIKEKQPEFMDAVEKALQYKLFRLGKPQEIHTVERLFRILVVLNKIQKDREKVRMLFCDALYCYNTRAMNMIYVALSSWSEVFPKCDAKNDILVKTIVHIVMCANVNMPFSKLMPLKRMLHGYYGYPNCGYRVENFKQELIDNLKENVPGVNTAIILLCKSKGPDWALEYIVKDLKKMIVSQVHPSMYDALTLLGDILRPFSSDNLKNTIEEITVQLCEVLTGNPGSHDLEEGIVSCLLNIGGKFSFSREKIAECVLKWQCKQELRQTTKDKFNSFLKSHNVGWWRKFVQQKFPVSE